MAVVENYQEDFGRFTRSSGNGFYIGLLDRSPGWSKYKETLLKNITDESYRITEEMFYNDNSLGRNTKYYYPRICNIVSMIVARRMIFGGRKKMEGVSREDIFPEILSISFLELTKILKKGFCSSKSLDNPNAYLQRTLYLKTIEQVMEEYGIKDRSRKRANLISVGFGSYTNSGSSGSENDNSYEATISDKIEEQYYRDNVVPLDERQQLSYDKAEYLYYLTTGRSLSLLELDHFLELMLKGKDKFSQIKRLLNSKEKKEIIEAIKAIKSHLKIKDNKVYNKQGILRPHVIEAVKSGLKSKKDIAKYLDERNIFYDRRTLARTVINACEANGITPPREPISETRQVNFIIYDCIDKGMNNKEIYEYLKENNYLTPKVMNSKTDIRTRITNSKYHYLKRKKKKASL